MTEGSLTKAALVDKVAHATGLMNKRAEIIVDTVFGNINEVTRRSPAVVGPGRR